jgi:hypothetical protein
MSGCVTASRSYQEVVEVSGPGSTAAKSEFARKFVTRERYERLQQRVKERFPSISEDELRNIYFRWQVVKPVTGAKPESVILVVGVGYAGTSLDGRAVARFCKEIIEREIQSAMRDGVSPS